MYRKVIWVILSQLFVQGVVTIQSEITTTQVIKGQVRSGKQEGDLSNLVSALRTVSGYDPV